MPPSPASEDPGHLGRLLNRGETDMGHSSSASPVISDERLNVDTSLTFTGYSRKRKRKTLAVPCDSDQLYACPYYKMDPIKHLNCFKRFSLKRIKDVKQHLHRKHYCIECLACGIEFASSGGYEDTHYQECPSAKLKAVGDAMSIEQRRAISFRTGGVITEEQQWFGVWRILFPEKPEPVSPYLGTELQEVIQTVHRYWRQNCHSIVANARQRSSEAMRRTHRDAFDSSMTAEESFHEFSATVLTETMDILLGQVYCLGGTETQNRVNDSSQSPSITESGPGLPCQIKDDFEALSSSNSRSGTQDSGMHEANTLGTGTAASVAIKTPMDFGLPLETPWIGDEGFMPNVSFEDFFEQPMPVDASRIGAADNSGAVEKVFPENSHIGL